MFTDHSVETTVSPFQATIPFISSVFCILLTMVPFGLSTGYLAPPSFALIAVFIWVLLRPHLMPPVAVFTLGILQDLFWGGPVGLWGLVFLIVYAFVFSQRQFLGGRGFGMTWTAFGVVASGAGLIAWIAASIFYFTPMPIIPILSQTILSFAVYPIFARCTPWFLKQVRGAED